MNLSKDNRNRLLEMERIWHSGDKIRFAKESHILRAEKLLYSRIKDIEEKKQNISKSKWLYSTIKYAAAIIILFIGTYFAINYFGFNVTDYEIVTTSKTDPVRQIILPDGTKVWLNHSSILKYPKKFTEKKRVVELEGEAYFEVTRDTARPFCVETAEQNIQVLGTIFNVYAYPDEPMNYTSLMSGKVAVTDKRTGTDRVLEPGQQVVLDVVTGKAAIQEADMQQVLGWRNHDLIVKEETLEVIMAKVARWYDVKIQFAHENLKKMRFTANLHRKKDLQELLKVIATIGDLRLTYQDGIVIIDFK